MLKKLTYKQKNKLLLGGAIVFFLLVYVLALKKTVRLYLDCSTLKQEMQLASTAPQKAHVLEQKLNALNHRAGYHHEHGDAQQNLLGVVSAFCQQNGLVLQAFPQTMTTDKKDILVATNVFTVQGGFIPLVRLVYTLEQKSDAGKVVSVDYHSGKNYNTHRRTLSATIYVQNVKKMQHEE